MTTPLAGRWTLGDPVRRDGLGDVLWATGDDGGTAWVRILPPRLSAAPGVVDRLVALPRVSARHLAPLVDVGVADLETGRVAYVAYAVDEDASDLQSLLTVGALPPRLAARVAADVCWGLTAAHAGGLVHGTLSARDVVVTEDFRGSKVVGAGLYPLVREALGTAPPRSAPEVRSGEAPTVASDMWSVGALLRLCVGDLADSSSMPLTLVEEIALLMNADPAQRPTSARAVATRLVGLATGLRELGGRARPAARPVSRARVAAAAPPPVPTPETVSSTQELPVLPPEAVLPDVVELPPDTYEPEPVEAIEAIEAEELPEEEPEDLDELVEDDEPDEPDDDPYEADVESTDVGGLPPVPARAGLPTYDVEDELTPPSFDDPTNPLPVITPQRPAAEPVEQEDRWRTPFIVTALVSLVVVGIVFALVQRSDRKTGGVASPVVTTSPSAQSSRTPAPSGSAAPASGGGTDSLPPPIVAPEKSTDPAVQSELNRIAVTAGDVGKGSVRAPVPDATDFNAFVRALYANCDYYTPAGSPRMGHRIIRFDLPTGVQIFNDVSYYDVPAQSVVDGLRTSLARCSSLQTTEAGTVVGRFTVRAPQVPMPGLPASAVELEYLSVQPADPPVRLVAFARGKVLDVVIARGDTTAELLDPARRVVHNAFGRLSAVAPG